MEDKKELATQIAEAFMKMDAEQKAYFRGYADCIADRTIKEQEKEQR